MKAKLSALSIRIAFKLTEFLVLRKWKMSCWESSKNPEMDTLTFSENWVKIPNPKWPTVHRFLKPRENISETKTNHMVDFDQKKKTGKKVSLLWPIVHCSDEQNLHKILPIPIFGHRVSKSCQICASFSLKTVNLKLKPNKICTMGRFLENFNKNFTKTGGFCY
jgi:hypothetical protein